MASEVGSARDDMVKAIARGAPKAGPYSSGEIGEFVAEAIEEFVDAKIYEAFRKGVGRKLTDKELFGE